MSLHFLKPILVCICLGFSVCHGTDNSIAVPNNTSAKQIPKGLHRGGQEDYANIATGSLSLDEKFRVYPIWRQLKSAIKYDRYGPYDPDLYNNILDYFIGFLEYTDSRLTSSKPLIAAFRGMSAPQLDALLYGRSNKSPICSLSFLRHAKKIPLFYHVLRHTTIDLSFMCYNSYSHSTSPLFYQLRGFLDFGPIITSKFNISTDELRIVNDHSNSRHNDEAFKNDLMNLRIPNRNLFKYKVLFIGSILTLEDVEYYFQTQRRQCLTVDFFGNSPLHVAMLHPNFSIVLYLLSEKSCKGILKHYNYEGNNALMFLLDNLPFTQTPTSVKYTTKIQPGPRDFTHSIAYYLVKRMLPRKKEDLKIKNKYGENTYDLALKTMSLPIIHTIFSYAPPSPSELENYKNWANEKDKTLYNYFVYLTGAVGTTTKEVSKHSLFDALEKWVALNNYNEVAWIFILNPNYDLEMDPNSSTSTLKYEKLIDRCMESQKRAMLWIFYEMGFQRTKHASQDILPIWQKFDDDILQEWKNEKTPIHQLFYWDYRNKIEEYLEKGVSPNLIFNHIILKDILSSTAKTRMETYPLLVKYGLTPNSSLTYGYGLFANLRSHKEGVKIYLQAGVNISYTPLAPDGGTNYFENIYYHLEEIPQLISVLDRGVKLNAPVASFGTIKKALAVIMDKAKDHELYPELEKALIRNNLQVFDN